MVSLQYGFGIAASQTLVAITLTKLSELLGGKASTTGVPRSPYTRLDTNLALLPPATVIELGELFRQTTPFTCFVTYVSIRMVCPRSLLH
jgi:hypothetical protein